MSYNKTVIKLENLGKQYRLGVIGTGTLSKDLNKWWARFRGKEDPYLKIGERNNLARGVGEYVWALRGINIEVEQGEVLGIIGKNGAGKSTLLKILSRVTGPTTGSARIKGRIASLLEVGTGFHPELTGKENIYLNGAILGMKRSEIKNKFDEIVDFSGVGRYIDTPVKRYSSGMYVRLAFAVAAHLDPEILIIDEVLAVGDLEFQKKCLAKMKDVAEGGKTVFFVSHNLSAVQNLCTSAMLLEGGEMVDKGRTEDIINLYKSTGTEMSSDKVIVEIQPDLSLPFQLNKVFITNSDKVSGLSIEFLEDCYINLEFVIREQNAYYYIYLHLQDIMGNIIFIAADDDLESGYPLGDISPGTYNYLIKVPGKILKPNQYYLTVNMVERYQGTLHPNSNIVSLEIVDTKSVRASKNLYRGVAIVAPEIHWELSENKTGV